MYTNSTNCFIPKRKWTHYPAQRFPISNKMESLEIVHELILNVMKGLNLNKEHLMIEHIQK